MNNIENEFAEVKAKYQGLSIQTDPAGGYIVSGYIGFITRVKELDIKDYFNIVINISSDYPKILPTAREVDGRIPQNFHKYTNGCLCLEIPIEQRIIFNLQPTLLGYIENLLIPYLSSFYYRYKTGNMPYEERPHAGAGVIQSYEARLNVKDDIAILGFLFMLSTEIFLRRQKCLCGSGNRFCHCHEKYLKELQKLQSKDEFYCEYKHVLIFLLNKRVKIPSYFVLDKIAKELKIS